MNIRPFAGAILAIVASHPALAAGQLVLNSDVFVERTELRSGKPHTVLAEPETVTPGDRLVFVLRYRNQGNAPASNMVITNPLPAAVAYHDAQGAQVSVDGGRNWGSLTNIRIPLREGGTRAARSEDVTHIRWQLAGTVPAGGEGNLKFRGTVR